MVKIKDLIDGIVVGTGTDYVVIEKKNNRYLIEVKNDPKELKNSTTPYGSKI